MSSNHPRGVGVPASGEIDHVYYLSEHFGSLYLNDDYSDIVLKVDGQTIYAHKVILAARSEYFRALLFGGLRESQQSEIELKGTSMEAFQGLLRYIYTGHMSLAALKEDTVLDILGLAHQYGFVDLETAISDFLRQALSLSNVCAVFDAARLYQLHYLIRVCASFMDTHAAQIITHESFAQLTPGGLKELLERDSFYAPEVDIFRSVVEWAKVNGVTDVQRASCLQNIITSLSNAPNDNLKARKTCLSSGTELESVLGTVRLQLMSVSELLGVVRPLRLVTPDTILDALTLRTTCRDSALNYRGSLKPEENVAHPNHGTAVLQGEMRTALLDGDCSNYDMERGYTRHAINEAGDTGILIKLGKQFIVNHIKMLLWDRDLRSYSYYIEVSLDQKDWTRVIDHTSYFCRSWQFLYFEPRVVRYIRIVGTNNTVNKVFHVVSFEVMYTNTPINIEKGLVVPKHNVARIVCSASVIEGVSRSRNALLDGETKRYDWDSGYTCHQLGSGSILVQLGQPYLLDTIRILLWDCDDRSYSYYVEVSVNLWDWELVWDKTRDSCQSWQYITFTRRPVVFIRIIGTHNTANEVFHCVHLECPAQGEEGNTGAKPDPAVNLGVVSKVHVNQPLPGLASASASSPAQYPDMAPVPTAAEATEDHSLKEDDDEEEVDNEDAVAVATVDDNEEGPK